MSEPYPSSPRRRLRQSVSILLAVLMLGIFVPPHGTAAYDGLVDNPAPFPVRGGGVKGEGTPREPEPTGRLIVRYRDGVTEAQRQRVRAADGLELVSSVALPDTDLVTPAEGGASQAITSLARRADVLWVEPEYRVLHMAGPTSEPLYPQQWALHNTGQTVQTYPGAPDVDMNVPEAWNITTGNPNLAVAVTDDGVDFSHPDLVDRRWMNTDELGGDGIDNDGNGFIDDIHGWDFCNGDPTVHDDDIAMHGTHVAGSIAASGNGGGIAGVAPSVKIMAIKFLPDDPEAPHDPASMCGTDVAAAAAIRYAYDNGARIINASWGGPGYSTTLYEAIEYASDALVVAAAGNSNSDNDVAPVYPASFDLPNILSVASIHNQGHLSATSHYGFESVDLSAPGEDILSSVPEGKWAFFTGTSMAAANASGVAALAASAKPALLGDGAALREHLIATAKALPSTLGWVATPRLLDARAAVVDRPDVKRLFGTDRFATAAAISRATYVPGVPYVFIAVGSSFPDALAGGAVAAQTGSPLLLVNQSSIPSQTRNELLRLRPYQIIVLGGPAVIGNTVFNQLQQYDDPSSGGVVRLAGPDRYATAAVTSTAFIPGVPTAFIANGSNFPDALAGVPASAVRGGPLLLATRTGIPQPTRDALDDLQPERIVILGGTGMISSSVASQLASYAPVSRMSGADRWATAADISSKVFPSGETAYVANGLGFPDALAGGPAAGAYGGPLLLTSPTGLPGATRAQLQRLDPARIFVLGGTGVISNTVINQINAALP